MWSSARPIRSISRPRSIRRSASCSTSARTISTATARMRALRRDQGAAGRRRAGDGTAIVGVDDDWCAAIADRLEQRGKQRRAHLGAPAAVATASTSRATQSCARPAARASRSRSSAASARCAASTMRRTPPCAVARRAGARPRRRGDPGGPALVSRPGAPHGAGRPQGRRAVRQRFQGDQCRLRRRRRWPSFDDIFWIAGGKPKDGGIDVARGILPAHPQGLPDRRGGAATSPRRSRARCPTRSPARSTARSSCGGATPRRARREGAGRAAVAGLRVLRPVPEFRGARRRLPRRWCWRCRASSLIGGVKFATMREVSDERGRIGRREFEGLP